MSPPPPPSPSDAAAFVRARRPEQKEQRREEILAAAARLAAEHGVRTVTLGQIAGEVGIAKSALLRYFQTREDIFLTLTARLWAEFVDDVAARIGRLRRPAPESVGRAVAAALVARPLLCDLFGQMAAVLERNVDTETVVVYKRGAAARVDAMTATLAAALPGLSPRGARMAAETTVVFTAGLWPMSTPAPAVAAALGADPSLARHQVDFERRVAELLATLLRGAAA